MDDEIAFEGQYLGCKEVVSKGGYVFQFLVSYDDADAAERIMGGKRRPDVPVRAGISRLTEIPFDE